MSLPPHCRPVRLPSLARLAVLGVAAFALAPCASAAPNLTVLFNATPLPANAPASQQFGTDFGTLRNRDLPPVRIFAVANSGDSPLTGIQATLEGDGFTLLRSPATALAPGAASPLWIQFAPGATGTFNAQILITSNDPDTNPFPVNLAGAGVPTMEELLPSAPPAIPPRARLTCFLGPTNVAPGVRWRFIGEKLWRTNGETVLGIVTNSYSVEFRSDGDWSRAALGTVAVSPGTNFKTWDFDFGAFTNRGSLTVRIAPPDIGTNAAWRIQGDDPTWLPSGTVISNLPPGLTTMEFRPVPGYSLPLLRDARILTNQLTEIVGSYRKRPSLLGVALPQPVPDTNLIQEPWAFNGQIQTEFGESSGVAITTNIVLTAASAVFNDSYLGFARRIRWFHRRVRNKLHEVALEPEVVIVAQGYSAERQRDQKLLDPLGNLASLESLNLNVAALGFNRPVARGSAGGFKASDQLDNPLLLGDQLKSLVSYPSFEAQGDAVEIMRATPPLNLRFKRFQDLDADRNGNPNRVFVSTNFLSNRGSIGGPLYVKIGDRALPAAVFLGSFEGVSFVRAIDRDVVGLLASAAAALQQPDAMAVSLFPRVQSRLSGGLVGVSPGTGSGQGGFFTGAVRGELAPSAAVSAGARWRVNQGSWQADDSILTGLAVGSFNVQFRSVSGFSTPSSKSIDVEANQTTVINATYGGDGSSSGGNGGSQALNARLLSDAPDNRSWRIGAAAQLDDDPGIEIVRYKAKRINVLSFAGTTNLGDATISDSAANKGWKIVAAGDFNQDGRDELVRTRRKTVQIQFLSGLTLSNAVVLPAAPDGQRWNVFGAGDVDHDLRDDVMGFTKKDLRLWKLDGTNVAAWRVLSAADLPKRKSITFADVGGDSRPDIIQAKGKEVYALLLDGTSIVAHGQVSSSGDNRRFKLRGAADFDADGLDDLIRQKSATIDILVTNSVTLE